MPRIASLFVCIVALIIIFSTADWKKDGEIINHDVKHYYAYLPALFIHKDIKIQYSTYYDKKETYYYWTEPGPNDSRVFKTSCGVAYLYAPFFFAADFYANFFQTTYLKNGYSAPYKLALQLAAVVYLFIGLFFLEKILKRLNFSSHTITVTLLLIGLGTNLLCYSSFNGPLSHVFSFALFSLFTYLSMLWYDKPNLKYSIFIGLTLGLIALIRPTNIIVGLIFLLYGVNSLSDFISRIKFLFSKPMLLITMLISFMPWWIPQFIYWKYVTGFWLYYPYGEEGFFWLHPKFYHGLVGFRKGWLIYTPLMVLAVVGLFLMKKRVASLSVSLPLFTFINMYIMFSWWCWWYGGSYGMRPMIDSYALLAIPFAITTEKILSSALWKKIVLLLCGLFFIWLNIFQTFQYRAQVLHYDSMNQRLYFKQFGKMERVPDFWENISPPDYEKARKTR